MLDIYFADDYSVNEGIDRMIDVIDRQILTILQNDARISNAEISRQIDLAPSGVHERLKKLEERGVIKGFRTEIDPHAIEFGLTAFVSVRTDEYGKTLDEALTAIPEVLEVHDVAGEDCYLLKVRTKDTEELGKLLRETIKPIANVISTRTTVVLHTFKETTSLPIEMEKEG